MLRSMLAYTRITAPDVSAYETFPQVNPLHAEFQTLDATFAGSLYALYNLAHMLALQDPPPRR